MSKLGIYVSPTEFVQFSEGNAKTRLSDQIATRERSPNFAALGMYLPNPDPILKKQGKDISVYRDLRSNAPVGGGIRRRKAAVLAMEARVERNGASARMTKLAESVIKSLNMDSFIREATDAVLYGWQPLEVVWSKTFDPRVPTQVIGKPGEWFTFDTQAHLRFKSRENPFYGDPWEDYKFLVPTQDASYANPYGFADLSMCFWPTVFIRGGLKFWVTFAEKYGTNFLVGKVPRGTGKKEQDELLDKLEDMVQDAVAVIPDDSSIEPLDVGDKAGSNSLYQSLLMFCRSEISIALLGQNQSTEASSTHASANAGLEVADSLRDGDARLVEATVNQLFRWMTDLNEGEKSAAPKYEMFEKEDLDLKLAERDKTLTEAGVRFTPAYWKRAYDLQDGDFQVVAPARPGADINATQGIAFAEGAAVVPASTNALAQSLAQAGDVVLAGWMQQIESMVNAAESRAALSDMLLQAYGDLPTDKLAGVMQLAFAAAELAGMYEVATDADAGG